MRVLISRGIAKHACFHGQQAAEKGLKALLLHLTGRIPQSHDLEQLFHAVRKVDSGFPDHLLGLQVAQGYYTLVRYPDARPPGAPMPSLQEAQSVLALAERLLADVKQRIPSP
ncbi:MAG: HEPN domain-containing protein [Planctomycetota bacterium]